MAGDGINDAPALATADVGIAMGTATDDGVLWWSSSTTSAGQAWVLSDNVRSTIAPTAVDEYYRFRCVATAPDGARPG